MSSTRLILIRHGETSHAVGKKYCGFSDPPLNGTGTWQAERLAERLKMEKIDKVYSSDLKRAYCTAKIAFKNNTIEVSKDLRELNFGIFEGLRHQEILNKYPKIYKNWIEDPLNTKIPNGEPFKSFKGRVLRILESIVAKNTGRVAAVITHGGPIKIFSNNILKNGSKGFWMIKQEVAALNIIDYVGGMHPEIVASNDSSHLI
ncbi:MAG: histidine phosphatase family protein [Candidatus Omnitrophica bacterium]|nr:histidine phosphatase family protein [Candidatus Omnitrophota bacterium]